MKPLAPRKHPNTEAPSAPKKTVREAAAPPVTPQEVALGVLTPALSDLAVLARVDAILADDHRSPDEVRARWAHLEPVVEAFKARLGAVDPILGADSPSATPEVAEVLDVSLPPDPGELSLPLED